VSSCRECARKKTLSVSSQFSLPPRNVGGGGPQEARGASLLDARNLKELSACEVLISCQGGDYTNEVYAPLRKNGWKGYWIDAASTLPHERRIDHHPRSGQWRHY